MSTNAIDGKRRGYSVCILAESPTNPPHRNGIKRNKMNRSEEIAEKVLKIAYEKGGTICGKDVSDEIRKSSDHNIDSILSDYGDFISEEIEGGITRGYYKMNDKGLRLARRGFFSGEEKEISDNRMGVRIAIITSIASIIMAIIALIR